MSSILRSTRCATIVGLLVTLGVASRALAEDTEVLDEVVGLNKEALTAYQNQDMESAVMTLKKALEVCNMEGIEEHTITARTHIHLGVVYIMGLKQRDLGLSEFRRALDIDPTIKMTRALNNPEVEAAWKEAMEKGDTALTTTPLAEPPQPESPERSQPPTRTLEVAGINHQPVNEATGGKAIEIKAQIPSTMGAETIILAYRADDESAFQTVEMQPIDGASSWYQAAIPADVTQGSRVSYYIEAQNDEGQRLTTNGNQAAPHQIRLKGRKESSPQTKSDGREDGSEPPMVFVLAVGAGGGSFSGSPEMNPRNGAKTLKSSGTGLATLAHLAPEVGYFWSENLIFSLKTRLQYVTGSEDVIKDGKTYKTTKVALAGLAKASWLLANPSDNIQPFIAAEAGLGEIRYPVKTEPLEGCGANGAVAPCKDTVRGGLGLFGGSAGLIYMLSEDMGFYTAISALATAPTLSLTLDLNLGIAFFR